MNNPERSDTETDLAVNSCAESGSDCRANSAPDPAGRASRWPSRGFVLYALIGVSGVALDYVLFLLLFNAVGLHEQLANAISVSAGITNNFVLNTLFNFRKRDRLLVRFLRFYAVGLSGIALTVILLQLFSGWLGIDPNLVKAASLPLVVLLQYSLNRKWSFA